MKKISKTLAKQLAYIDALPDDQIDFSDIPEVLDWSDGVVGKYYRPIKKPLTIRVDADVLAWLKKPGPGYQTRINRLLREAMNRKVRRRKAS